MVALTWVDDELLVRIDHPAGYQRTWMTVDVNAAVLPTTRPADGGDDR